MSEPQSNAGTTEPESTKLNDAGIALNWLAWPMFAVLTFVAFLSEMYTLYANAGLGYYFIMLGMPVFAVAWFYLVVYASFRRVPTAWLFGAPAAAAVIALGYASINNPL